MSAANKLSDLLALRPVAIAQIVDATPFGKALLELDGAGAPDYLVVSTNAGLPALFGISASSIADATPQGIALMTLTPTDGYVLFTGSSPTLQDAGALESALAANVYAIGEGSVSRGGFSSSGRLINIL